MEKALSPTDAIYVNCIENITNVEDNRALIQIYDKQLINRIE